MFYITLLLAVALGIEEKSFWEKNWDIVMGGGLGWLFGIGAFAVVGVTVWFAGPFMGAFGLISMATGGLLGGLGLGSVIHVLRDPSDYNFNVPVISAVAVGGMIVSWFLSNYIDMKIELRERRRAADISDAE
ncbi:hypothetical protein [Halomonas denitrificans]|nr:hypothetical protein [Halomonas denitrificans]